MANSKISALTSATTPLVGTETLPIVQGGVTVKTTVADITNGGGYAGSFTTLGATGNTTLGDASTDTVRINGTLGVGGAALANKAIQVQNTLSGSNPIGVDLRPVITTTGGTIVATFATGASGSLTANAGSAVSAYGCYLTEPNVIVTSGSVTNAATVFINEGPTEGGTLNANLYTNAATGTNKWNIYASGTANNYFAGNIVQGTAAKGFDFSANTPLAGKTSTLLNWYEEGTWTPNQGAGLTLVGAFSSTGRYTRIGRQVSISGTVTGATSVAVTAAGVITSNLPFTVVTAGHGGATNVANNASATVICTSTSITSAAAIAATATITFSATYFV